MKQIKLISPSDLLKEANKKVTKESMLGFVSAFIAGVLCHLYILTNYMFNNDEAHNLFVNNDRTDLGRWTLGFFSSFGSDYGLPVINGLIAIFFFALSAALLVHILKLKNKLFIVLLSAMYVCFPSVTCMLSFTFTVDAYGIASFLGVLAAYLITKTKDEVNKQDKIRLIFLGAISLGLSMGIYQAYLPVTLLVMLFVFLIKLADGEADVKEIISFGLGYIAMLAVGVILYFVGLMAALSIKGKTLSSYQGISDSGAGGLAGKIEGIKEAIRDFIAYFTEKSYLNFNKYVWIATVCMILILVIGYTLLVIKNRTYRKPLNMVLTLFCMICVPVSINIMYIISAGVVYHGLMRHAWVLLFFFAATIFEQAFPDTDKSIGFAFVEWIMVVSIFVACWNYAVLDNKSYYNMNFRYERTVQFLSRVMNDLEAWEDYDDDLPVAFVGKYSRTFVDPHIEEDLDIMAGTGGKRAIGDGGRNMVPFINNVLGLDIEGVPKEIEEAISTLPEFEEMSYYPDEGCFEIINGINVIKLND